MLRATRNRLAATGFARLTIGDVAADAGVSRPAVYRRWATKEALVAAALDSSSEGRQSRVAALDLGKLPPRIAVTEAVRHLYDRSEDGPGIRVVAKVLAEADQTPELLDVLREHALRPRRDLFLETLRTLQARQALRADLDLEVVAEMCLGGFLASYLADGEGEEDARDGLATRMVDALWPYLQGPP